jgi:hypothetical protein
VGKLEKCRRQTERYFGILRLEYIYSNKHQKGIREAHRYNLGRNTKWRGHILEARLYNTPDYGVLHCVYLILNNRFKAVGPER